MATEEHQIGLFSKNKCWAALLAGSFCGHLCHHPNTYAKALVFPGTSENDWAQDNKGATWCLKPLLRNSSIAYPLFPPCRSHPWKPGSHHRQSVFSAFFYWVLLPHVISRYCQCPSEAKTVLWLKVNGIKQESISRDRREASSSKDVCHKVGDLFLFPRPTWWKKRTNTHKWSSYLHRSDVPHLHTHTHTYSK